MDDGFLKNILKPFYYAYKKRCINNHAFSCAKQLLKVGLYYNPYGTRRFCKMDKGYFNIKNIFKFQLWVNSVKECDAIDEIDFPSLPLDSVEFGVGQGKVVLMSGDKAYGFYDSLRLYQNSRNNYYNHIEKFNYPSVQVLGFYDRKRLIVMNLVSGVVRKDYTHDKILVQEMLKIGAMSDTRTQGDKTLFLQHGDAKRENVLWNNESFCFIDLDNINYLPPMFDVFHYLNNCDYDLMEVMGFLEDNKSAVEKICCKANISIEDNPLDCLFRNYVDQFIGWGGALMILNFS